MYAQPAQQMAPQYVPFTTSRLPVLISFACTHNLLPTMPQIVLSPTAGKLSLTLRAIGKPPHPPSLPNDLK